MLIELRAGTVIIRMSTKGYVNMGALKSEIRKLCSSFGLEHIEVCFTDDRKCVSVRHGIDVQQRLDVDPTEESNAVGWGDN